MSPASAAKPELVELGRARLQAFGYDTIIMPHALDHGPLYYAGTAADRVADLHAAFADPTIEGVLCTRGGWGSAELLPLLDATLIRANPKVFVGYSDHTSLHAWLWNECRLPTFYAPMVAADWSNLDGVDYRTWRAALQSAAPWSVGAEDGLRTLRAGHAEGRLLGGCLSILVSLLGTPFEPQTEGKLLFLEDTGAKPYQIDRMLWQLRQAAKLDGVRGIVFGEMLDCASPGAPLELLEEVILRVFDDFSGPIAIGLRSGHVSRGNVTLTLGVEAELATADEATLRLLEPAVIP